MLREAQDDNAVLISLINQLLYAGLRYDEYEFDKYFSEALKRYGFKRAYVEIIYPLIERLGLLWAESTIIPSQEHYVTNLIRQKIIAATEDLSIPTSKETWILFLPEDEFHELGLLVANYLLKLSGRRTIYLGANLPLSTLEQAVRELKPDAVLFFSVRKEETDVLLSYVDKLGHNQRIKHVFIAKPANADDGKLKGRKIRVLNTVDDLERNLS
jgi:methanogenic corrinoid protein MtbC1